MQGLIEKPGHWRSGQVGIFKESKVTHVAPSAARVPGLMTELFKTLKESREHHPLFEFLPVESIVRERQREYYAALERSDRDGNASHFVEFSLATIEAALGEWMQALRPEPVTPESRLEKAMSKYRFHKKSRG